MTKWSKKSVPVDLSQDVLDRLCRGEPHAEPHAITKIKHLNTASLEIPPSSEQGLTQGYRNYHYCKPQNGILKHYKTNV